jgi:hypothetical protein
LPDLRGVHLFPDCGHWTQQERPQAVNDHLLTWLRGLAALAMSTQAGRAQDATRFAPLGAERGRGVNRRSNLNPFLAQDNAVQRRKVGSVWRHHHRRQLSPPPTCGRSIDAAAASANSMATADRRFAATNGQYRVPDERRLHHRKRAIGSHSPTATWSTVRAMRQASLCTRLFYLAEGVVKRPAISCLAGFCDYMTTGQRGLIGKSI